MDRLLVYWHVKQFARVLDSLTDPVLDTSRVLFEGEDERCNNLPNGGWIVFDQPLTINRKSDNINKPVC